MKIALFGREVNPRFLETFQSLVDKLNSMSTQVLIFDDFYKQLAGTIRFGDNIRAFHSHREIDPDTRCLISVGGDGTLLDTITLIRDSGIPVLGINTGRLGFLSAVSIDEIGLALDAIFQQQYRLDKRSLIQLVSPENLHGEVNFALNELTILKRDNSSMISIHAYVNDLYLNTYWADGLIVATPTGSTGYSLSCGGPIIVPDSNNFVITPIATHNLTVRPIIIPDKASIKLRISGRSQDFLVILDSRSRPLSNDIELIIKKADFSINLICLDHNDFFKTIRNKLAWGLDKRN